MTDIFCKYFKYYLINESKCESDFDKNTIIIEYLERILLWKLDLKLTKISNENS